jgi:hypothetical protein
MSIQQKDHILRLIEQAAAALRRLRERLASTSDEATQEEALQQEALQIAQEAQRAQRELLGEHGALLQALDPASAAAMVRDPERLTLWVELLRVQAAAHRRAGDPTRADALEARASALHATLGPRP